MFIIFVPMLSIENKYWKLLPLAYKIYEEVCGHPKSHAEWAEGFNKRGKIIKTLIDNDNKTDF